MNQSALDQLLFAAIQQSDVNQLKHWLQLGANPNAKLRWFHDGKYELMSPLYLLMWISISLFMLKEIEIESEEMKPYQESLVLLLDYGAKSCYYQNEEVDVIPWIALNLNSFYKRNYTLLDDIDDVDDYEEDYKLEIAAMELCNLVITKLLSNGVDPNSMSPLTTKRAIDHLGDIHRYVNSDSEDLYIQLFQDLLRHGSYMASVNIDEVEEHSDNLFYFFIDLPNLVIIYCLEKRNVFTYL